MRFMKRLLTAVYLYLGIFFVLCLLCWIITGEEPAALIAGISTAAGVESVIAGCIRMREMQEEQHREKTGQTNAGISPENAGELSAEPPGKDSVAPCSIDPAWGEK